MKGAGIGVIALLALLLVNSVPVSNSGQQATTYSPPYSTYNLIFGDATWTCPGVTLNQTDIAISPNSLTANVNKKAAQVHADSFFKATSQVAKVFYQIQFSLPYQPRSDPSQKYNPQTIESAAEIWRGDTKTKYTSGIQWALNPWTTTRINVWRNDSWVPVLNATIQPNATYRYTIYLDWQQSGNGYSMIEQKNGTQWNLIGKWQSWSSVSVPSWGPDISWWVTAEIISATPSCGSNPNGFVHETNWMSPYIIATPLAAIASTTTTTTTTTSSTSTTITTTSTSTQTASASATLSSSISTATSGSSSSSSPTITTSSTSSAPTSSITSSLTSNLSGQPQSSLPANLIGGGLITLAAIAVLAYAVVKRRRTHNHIHQ